MKLFKVLLLCVTILSECTRESKSIDFDPTEDQRVDYDNQEERSASSTEECFCLPINPLGIRVSEHFSLDGEQVRLVVYLYKNKNNKITIYIPNREKQILLPDLTLDEKDGLDIIDTQKVTDFFYIYADMTIPENNPSNNEQYLPGKRRPQLIIPGKNLNLNVEKKLPNYNDHFLYYPGVENTFPPIPDTLDSPDTSENEINSGHPPEIPNINEYLPNYHYYPTVNGIPGNGNFIAYKPPRVLPFKYTPENMPNIKNQLNEGGILMPDTSIPGSDNGYVLKVPNVFTPDPNLQQPFEQHQQVHETPFSDNIIFVPSSDVIQQFEPDVSNADNFQLRPQKNAFFTPYMEYTNQQKTLPGKKFEEWFQKQIALILQKRYSKSQAIDKNELRTLILNVLHKNGIIVNKTGHLVDSNGNFLDLTNVQLRPILLGDPAEYHKLLAAQKCVIPHKLPYFEAILVTLKNPPKILGIVPLGKTFNQILYETKKICNSGLRGNEKNCKGIQCNKNKIKAYETDKLKVLLGKGLPSDGTSLNLRPIGQNLLHTLIMKDPKSKTGMNPEDKLSSENIDFPEDLENKKIEDDDDSPGIRIIGGHPAISSGAMVQNKGRSGQDYD
ncbi:uncharacterized protein LOC126776793 [Nymphalis io]|uniref:uncharacterized protein LOC126776793 n=1 Tax=Inachis io TaxID=171585 RepID=UPI0021681332|nr:uncharacterized protein LOC126776793 [Nymphalis io]